MHSTGNCHAETKQTNMLKRRKTGKKSLRVFYSGTHVLHISCRESLHNPTLASFLGIRIGSSAWRYSEGQGLVLVYLGEGNRNNYKETSKTVFGDECEVVEIMQCTSSRLYQLSGIRG